MGKNISYVAFWNDNDFQVNSEVKCFPLQFEIQLHNVEKNILKKFVKSSRHRFKKNEILKLEILQKIRQITIG